MYRDDDEFGGRFNLGLLLVQLAVCGGLLLFISFYNHTFVHFSFPSFLDFYSIIMLNIFTCIDDEFQNDHSFPFQIGSLFLALYMYM